MALKLIVYSDFVETLRHESILIRRVLWLDRRERRVWGEIIFAATSPSLRPVMRAQAAVAR